MCTQCVQEISLFRQRTTAGAWKLDRQLLADRLTEMLADPDSIQQGAIGLCGNAAFLRAWVQNDHLAVARFAISLYEVGHVALPALGVQPGADLLNCDYAAIDWHGMLPCPAAEWMIMSALQDQENGLIDFSGPPNEANAEGLYGHQVVDMFAGTGLYSAVGDSTPWINWHPFAPGIEELLAFRPDDDTDVVLCVNAQVFQPGLKDTSFWSFVINDEATHFIGLCEPATKVVDAGVEKIHLRFFSWGNIVKDDFLPNALASNYYGAVVAEAKVPKKALPAVPTAAPSAPFGLAATLSGNTVTLTWKDRNLFTARYSVERSGAGGFSEVGSIDAKRPSTLGGSFQDSLPATPGPQYWYRVSATGPGGQSDWSYTLMVSVPSGATRETHWWDDDIATPPMHVRQFTVVRAPAGLTPTGYGKFPDTDCDCARPQVVYDATWSPSGIHQRQLNKNISATFKPNRAAYLFTRFSPVDRPGSDVLMEGGPVTAAVVGVVPGGPAPFTLTLSPGAGAPAGAAYYWGGFDPSQQGFTSRELKVEIVAQDTLPRFGPRSPSGHELDGNPADEAYVAHDPPYPFAGYMPGPDRWHRFTVGSIAQTVSADDKERPVANNDFDHATAVPVLTPAASGRASQVYSSLSLHDAVDVDYFSLQFATSTEDRACTITQPTTEIVSQLLGLSIVHYPPQLVVSVTSPDCDCIDLGLCASKAQGYRQTHDLHGKYGVSIWNPALTYPDSSLYVVVKNGDYLTQGAFYYGIGFEFTHALNTTNIDANAPAYRPRTTASRKYLRRIIDALDLPRPGENPAQQVGRDIRGTIKALTAVLVDQATAATLEKVTGRDVRTDIAASSETAARTAAGLDMADEAVQLHRNAAAVYRSVDDQRGQVTALTALATYYKETGSPAKATEVEKEIEAVAPVRIIR